MPKSVERCVKKVGKQKGTKNAWAICQASHQKAINKRKKK